MTRQASTRDVPARLKIDAESLRRHLSAVIPELESRVEVSKFTGGQSNPTYLIEGAGKRLVLRRKPPGTVLSSAHAIDREARVMSAVASAGFPVPEVIHECSDPSIIGSPFYLMSYLDGRIFWNPLLADAQRAERELIYFALTDTLADLHAIEEQQHSRYLAAFMKSQSIPLVGLHCGGPSSVRHSGHSPLRFLALARLPALLH